MKALVLDSQNPGDQQHRGESRRCILFCANINVSLINYASYL